MATQYYAHYTAVDNSGIGFISESSDDIAFPPSVQYNGNAFRLLTTYQVASPKQQKNFEAFCENLQLEMNVQVK